MTETHRPSPPATTGLLSAFKTWLPHWPSEGAQAVASQDTAATGLEAPLPSALRVLVVDDNPVNLMVLSAQMGLHGLVPLLAADGAEAVALACSLPFDLILMDLQMPILDGFGATEAIRRFEASCARLPVPVLAFTTSHLASGVLAQHGMNGSLAKPCEDRELEDCLLQWCPTYRSVPRLHGPYSGLSFAPQQCGGQPPLPLQSQPQSPRR